MRVVLTFVNLLALVWCGTEAVPLAASGTFWPMLLLTLAGTLAFVLIGCLPTGKAAMNLGVYILVGALVVTGVYFAIGSLGSSVLVALLKFAGVAVVAGANLIGLALPDEVDAAH